MMESLTDSPVRSGVSVDAAIVSAGDYLNKHGGQLVERECHTRLEDGCRALIINFRDTKLVNSIGVSILLGIIDAAEEHGAHVVFAAANDQTMQLFELLGITQHVALAQTEQEALALFSKQPLHPHLTDIENHA
jgi:anti-anti-sigma factor